MVLKKLRMDNSGQSKLHILEFIIHTEGYVNGWELPTDALASLSNRDCSHPQIAFYGPGLRSRDGESLDLARYSACGFKSAWAYSLNHKLPFVYEKYATSRVAV